MRAKPKRVLSSEKRQSRRLQYQHLRKQGLRPFADAKLASWEKRLLARSLRLVLETSIGSMRHTPETERTVKKIIPLAARELKPAMKDKLPADQWNVFCQLMDWYARNPKFPPEIKSFPQKIMDLGKKLSQDSLLKFSGRLISRTFFRLKNEERPEHRKEQFDFQKDLEFQLKHDIGISLIYIKDFLEKLVDLS